MQEIHKLNISVPSTSHASKLLVDANLFPSSSLESANPLTARTKKQILSSVIFCNGNSVYRSDDPTPVYSHRFPVHHIKQRKGLLCTIDANGIIGTSPLDNSGKAAPTFLGSNDESLHESPQPGYCGIDLSDDDVIASVEFWKRRLRIYKGGTLIKHMHLTGHPTNIKFVDSSSTATSTTTTSSNSNSNSNVFVLLEQNLFTVIDLRAQNNKPVAVVAPGHHGWLYGLDVCDHYMAVAGEERCVHVFDDRKWSVVGRWANAVKHEALSVRLLPSRPEVAVAYGRDYEFACASWLGSASIAKASLPSNATVHSTNNNTSSTSSSSNNNNNNSNNNSGNRIKDNSSNNSPSPLQGRKLSVRGDSFWQGVDVVDDAVVGLSQTGVVYAIPSVVASLLSLPSSSSTTSSK